MASRPDGDVWNIVDNDKDSQHYGRNFKFDFSYISSEEIKDVVKDYVWQNYRVGNKSLSTLYREVNSFFFQFINQLLFLCGYFVFGFEILFYIDRKFFFLQVANMSVT